MDIHARDCHGHTVSDIAYGTWNRYSEFRNGSYEGDLWDSVLIKLGYDVLKYRSDITRIPSYTKQYTRAGFEVLWEGSRTHCPYWIEPP